MSLNPASTWSWHGAPYWDHSNENSGRGQRETGPVLLPSCPILTVWPWGVLGTLQGVLRRTESHDVQALCPLRFFSVLLQLPPPPSPGAQSHQSPILGRTQQHYVCEHQETKGAVASRSPATAAPTGSGGLGMQTSRQPRPLQQLPPWQCTLRGLGRGSPGPGPSRATVHGKGATSMSPDLCVLIYIEKHWIS